jgi:2-oxoglutarate ferredoxin oxidoreductase subunit alpha
MVKLRQEKVDKIAHYIPDQQLDSGPGKGRIALLAWGSTYGVIRAALRELREEEGIDAAHIHLRYINPFPKNLEALLRSYDTVLVPEINNGQLVRIIRDRFLIDAKPLNKIKGVPFATSEIKSKIKELLGA